MSPTHRPVLAAATRPSRDPIVRYGHPETSCVRKRRYGRSAARLAARQISQEQYEPVKAYVCPHCRHWHIAHGPGSDRA